MSLFALDVEIKEWIFNGVDVSDDGEVQNAPDIIAFVGLIQDSSLAVGTMSRGFNWTHKGNFAQFETAQPIIDQDSYSLVNAKVVWTSAKGSLRLGLQGNTLTDEEVKMPGYCFGSGGCASTFGLRDNATIFYGLPCMWAGTVGTHGSANCSIL